MTDFLSDLYNYISEDMLPLRKDPEYERAVQAYMEIEAEVKEKIGLDLLLRYQRAQNIAFGWEKDAIFTRGLRFGSRFMLEVLG